MVVVSGGVRAHSPLKNLTELYLSQTAISGDLAALVPLTPLGYRSG